MASRRRMLRVVLAIVMLGGLQWLVVHRFGWEGGLVALIVAASCYTMMDNRA